MPIASRRVAAVLIALASVASAGYVAPDAAAARHVYAGYFGGWNVAAKGYYPKDIPARRLTHVYYAFAVPGADGNCAPTSPWADYQRPFSARESVDGVADDPASPGSVGQLQPAPQAEGRTTAA